MSFAFSVGIMKVNVAKRKKTLFKYKTNWLSEFYNEQIYETKRNKIIIIELKKNYNPFLFL